MKVKFKKDYVLGRAQVKQGDVIDVPQALRDQLVQEGVVEDAEKEGKEK